MIPRRFSDHDHQNRLARMRSAMEAPGLDACPPVCPANIDYLRDFEAGCEVLTRTPCEAVVK